MNGSRKLLRGIRQRRRLGHRTKGLLAVSALAAAGMLAVGSPAAYADVTINGYRWSPGTSGAEPLGGLTAGANETVTAPSTSSPAFVYEVSELASPSLSTILELPGGFVASFAGTHTATGPVSLFAGSEGIEFPSPGTITDCAGQSITGSSRAGYIFACGLEVTNASGAVLNLAAISETGSDDNLAFPAVTQGVSKSTGLNNNESVTLLSNAQGEFHYASTDQIAVEECRPMPNGFDINQCVGLGSMSGTSGNYSATLPVHSQVGSTVCATHGGSTDQCELWTVEVHNDSTGRYWWPLASGVPVSFK